MKKYIIAVSMLMLWAVGHAQELRYEIRGAFGHPVTSERLQKAVLMGDIIDYYPSQWIRQYVSTEIVGMRNENSVVAAGTSETLTQEQQALLKNVDPGSDVVIIIKYTYENPVTGKLDPRTLNYTASVVPETQAEYTGGGEAMRRYMDKEAIGKIPSQDFRMFPQVLVRFTVNELGKIVHVQMKASSGDPHIDTLILDAIRNMSPWSPALDAGGATIPQEFEFRLGGADGC